MMRATKSTLLCFFFMASMFSSVVLAAESECGRDNECTNKNQALKLKVIAIFVILITSMIGVCLPLFSKKVPALSPERALFIVVKAFAAGIILATGFMHVLPDSFDMLSSDCLPDNPWHKFPFTGFVAMLSAIVTLMVDSLATSFYSKRNKTGVQPENGSPIDREMGIVEGEGHVHVHGHGHGLMSASKEESGSPQLLRYRVIAMVISFFNIFPRVYFNWSLFNIFSRVKLWL